MGARLLLLFVFLPSLVAGQLGRCGATENDLRQIGHKVEVELPLGSTLAQVNKFLDGMQLPHGHARVESDDPVRRYRKLRQMGTTIENAQHTEPSIYLQFYFNKRGRLVEAVAQNACGRGCYAMRQGVGVSFHDRCQ